MWVSVQSVRRCKNAWKLFFCMFVCMHACVHTLNATIQASELLIQTTVEQKSINNTRVHSENDVILVQRAGKWEGEKQQCWTPASTDIFSIERNFCLSVFYDSNISTTHWHNNDNTLKKYCSLWVDLIRLSYAHMNIWEKAACCRVAVPKVLHSQRSFL